MRTSDSTAHPQAKHRLQRSASNSNPSQPPYNCAQISNGSAHLLSICSIPISYAAHALATSALPTRQMGRAHAPPLLRDLIHLPSLRLLCQQNNALHAITSQGSTFSKHVHAVAINIIGGPEQSLKKFASNVFRDTH